MKTLIIYLSATGKTERLAREIANVLDDADLLPIVLKTTIPISEFWLNLKFGFLMSFDWGFRFHVPDIDVGKYDQVIIGTPVWMGRAAPPLLTVINNYDIGDKVRGAFVTCGGGTGQVFEDLCHKTSILSLENRLGLVAADSYDDPNIQDKIHCFADAMKASETFIPQSLVYEG